MNYQEIYEHAQQTRAQAVEKVVLQAEGGLEYYGFVTRARNRKYKTQEERDFWDFAFLHKEMSLAEAQTQFQKEHE